MDDKENKAKNRFIFAFLTIFFTLSWLFPKTPSSDLKIVTQVCDSFITNLKNEKYVEAYNYLGGSKLDTTPDILKEKWENYKKRNITGWNSSIGGGSISPYNIACIYDLNTPNIIFSGGRIKLSASPQDQDKRIWKVVAIVWD